MPSAQKDRARALDEFAPAVGVVVGGEGPGVGDPPGPFDEEAVGLAVGVPADGPARRVGRRPTDAEGVEPPAVDHGLVDAVVGHQHRPVEAEGVQVPAMGPQWLGQVVPPPAVYPRGVGLPFGHLPQPPTDLLHRRGATQIGPPRGEGTDRQVLVGIDEPGAEGPTAEVDHLGPVVAVEQLATADSDDAAIADDEHVRRRAPTGHGEDPAAGEGDQRSWASMASIEAARISTIWSATSVSMHSGGARPTTSIPMARA